MTVGELLTAICLKNPNAEIIMADSPFCDGTAFSLELVTEDDEGRVVLSPDVVLALRSE
jgi:hypothetical protein